MCLEKNRGFTMVSLMSLIEHVGLELLTPRITSNMKVREHGMKESNMAKVSNSFIDTSMNSHLQRKLGYRGRRMEERILIWKEYIL